jgi:hypothetical protein
MSVPAGGIEKLNPDHKVLLSSKWPGDERSVEVECTPESTPISCTVLAAATFLLAVKPVRSK